jgi:hypothetical protein
MGSNKDRTMTPDDIPNDPVEAFWRGYHAEEWEIVNLKEPVGDDDLSEE